MSSPAERGDRLHGAILEASRHIASFHGSVLSTLRAAIALLPHGSLVFHTRTEVLEWLRGEGLVVLDKQQTETGSDAVERAILHLGPRGKKREGATIQPLSDDLRGLLALLSAGEEA